MSVLKWVLVFVFQLPVSGLLAQTLLMLDDQTRLPVANVLIFNTAKTGNPYSPSGTHST